MASGESLIRRAWKLPGGQPWLSLTRWWRRAARVAAGRYRRRLARDRGSVVNGQSFARRPRGLGEGHPWLLLGLAALLSVRLPEVIASGGWKSWAFPTAVAMHAAFGLWGVRELVRVRRWGRKDGPVHSAHGGRPIPLPPDHQGNVVWDQGRELRTVTTREQLRDLLDRLHRELAGQGQVVDLVLADGARISVQVGDEDGLLIASRGDDVRAVVDTPDGLRTLPVVGTVTVTEVPTAAAIGVVCGYFTDGSLRSGCRTGGW